MPDERFWRHRYQATSHAAVVGATAAGAWLLYDLWGHGIWRWDLFSVLAVMAVTKLAAMLYYRIRD